MAARHADCPLKPENNWASDSTTDLLVPKLAASAISMSTKQIFSCKLQFKYQKYTRGWAVGWVASTRGLDPKWHFFVFAYSFVLN